MKSKNRGLIPPQPKRRPAVLASSIAALAVLCLAPRPASAQTWLANPVSGDWNTTTNWNGGVPDAPNAAVTFASSTTQAVSLSAGIVVGSITFTATVTSPYTITTGNSTLFIDQAGIINNSGVTQNFIAGPGGTIEFQGGAAAGSLTQFTTQGATSSSGPAGTLTFTTASSAGSSTITTNGGTNGGLGGTTSFSGNADGGTASAITNAGGTFDISDLISNGMNIGAISGAGTYSLGSKTLTTGGANLANTVSGVIQDGGQNGGTGGSLVVTGSGSLTLTGQNTYTGQTTVNGSTLQLGASGHAGTIASTSNITIDPNGTLVVVNTGGAFANSVNVQGSTGLTGGTIIFSLNSTAGTANILNGGGTTDNASGGSIDFNNSSTAGSAQITNNGGTTNSAFGASTSFFVNATAGNSTITNNGGTVSGALGSVTTFGATSSAGTATLTANGATVNGAGGGTINFTASSSAGQATLNITGGSNGGGGGTITFQGSADGGTATVNNNAGGTFDISGLTIGGMNIGSINGSGTFNLGSKTLTVVASSFTNVSGVIADGGQAPGTGGSLTVSTGGLGLSGQNTYTGTTSLINGATLFAEVTGALPAPVADGGNGTARAALAMDLTGTGGSTLVIEADQAVSSLTGAASSTINLHGHTLNGHTLTVGNMFGATSTFAGVIADGSGNPGSGGLTVDGDGVLNLTGNNTYTGQTTVNGSAILGVGNGSTGNLTGTSGVSVANGASLLVNLASGSVFSPNVQLNGGSASLMMTSVWTNIVSGVVSGTGSLAQDSSGTTILTGANTYSGGTFVNAGTIQLGTATAAASIATNPVTVHDRSTLSLVNVAGGTFANDVSNDQSGVGTVNINSATTITLSGALRDGAGQLALTKNGPGTAIISGINNHYTGATTVNGGILEVDGSLGQTTITVNKNAALSGDGIAGNDVNIETGGSLETGGGASTGVRTIVVGNLVLNTGANTIFRLGAPGTSDFVDTGGTLTLGGTLNVVPLAGFGAGTYSLFGFGIGVSKSFIVSAIPGYTTATTTVGNTVNLIVTAATGTLAEQNWNSIGNGMSNGGSGTWNTIAVNWSDPSSSGTTHWLGGTADFGVTGGTVSIPAATTISAQGLIFDVDGYSINGTSPTTSALSLTQKATITVNTGTATLNTKVTGSAGLLANGPGTLVLANTGNAITGKVSVVTGTLQISTAVNDGSIGAGAVTLSNGSTLRVLNVLNDTLPNAISAGVGQTGTVNIASVNPFTLSGALTDSTPGQLALTLSGSAITILTNSKNTFSGPTTIGANTLQIGTSTAAGSLGASSPVIFNGAGVLSLVNVGGNVFANNISNRTAGAATIEVNGVDDLILPGQIADFTGTISFEQNSSGETILPGSNFYAGTTSVNAGTLQIGDGTTVGTTIASSGQVQVNGSGILATDLSSSSTFANAVSLNTATSVFNAVQTGTNTLSGIISGSGTFTQKGTGRTILTADETYTGATTVSAGVLQVGDGRSGNLTGPGLVNVSGTGILALDLANGAIFSPSVKLTATANQLQAIQTGFTQITGTISGAGVLDQNGPGTTELTAAETYTGGTNVNAGTLVVDTSLAADPVNVKGGTLEVDGTLPAGGTAAVTVNTGGMLTGSGTIGSKMTLTGGGTINFSSPGDILGTLGVTGGNWNGLGTVGGVITASSGNFIIGTGATLTSLAGLAVTGGTLSGTGTIHGNLTYTSASSSTFAGVLAGNGATLTMNKAGATLTLTGDNTYTGATTVSGGTLQIGDGHSGNLGSTTVTVSGTGVLAVNQPDTAIFSQNVTLGGTGATLQSLPGLGITNSFSGVISGTGGFNQTGAGTTILTNTETYTGPTKVTGTLEVDGSLAAASTVNVGTAATLTGTGTINGNATLTGNGTINLSIGAVIGGTLAITGGNWTGHGDVLGPITSSSGVFNLNGSLAEEPNAQSLFPGLTITSGTLAGTGTLFGRLIYASSASSTFGGVIENGQVGGSLVMNNAAATLTLTGIGQYGGYTKVTAGTLQIGNGVSGNLAYTALGARQGEVDVSGTGVLALDLKTMDSFPTPVKLISTGASLKAIEGLNGQQTISGFISGSGMFDQNGLGTTIITNDDAYTGPTNVNAGVLDIEGSLAAASTVHVGTAGTLVGQGTAFGNATLTGNGVIAFSGSNSGIAGTLAVTGGHWNGAGTVGGLVTSSSGTFNLEADATLTALAGVNVTGGIFTATDSTATLAGNLNDTSSSSFTFDGVIADHGVVPSTVTMNKAGATLTLTGANTYSGVTTVSAGTLQIGDGINPNTSLDTSGITVSGTGVLAANLADGATLNNPITLSGTGATLKPIQSGTNTISGILSGTGGLNQAGPGRTILTQVETYTGATTVTAGILQVDGHLAAASTVNVSDTGTLAGIGTILGPVNVAAGGTVSPGDAGGPGTLTVSKLVLRTGGNSNFRLNTAGTTGGGVNDLLSVTGNLTIAGNLNVTQLANFGVGTYPLFNYATLTNTGFTNINGIGGFAASVSATAGTVSLVVTGPAATQYWDGAGTVANSAVGGGTGMWNNTTTNWTNSGGTANAAWSAGNAIFGNTPGAVTIAAPVSAQSLTFNVNGYALTGTSPLNLVGSASVAPKINVVTGATATIGAPLTGIAGLNANGGGTLILTNPANTYLGGTQVSTPGGALQVGLAATAGSLGGGTVRIVGGSTLTLVNVHGNVLPNNVTGGGGTGANLTVNSTLATTLSGALTDGTGTLALLQEGTGTTTLTNAGNTFSQGVNIYQGTLQVGTTTAASSLGSASVNVLTGGTLSLVNVSGNVFGNSISGASGTGTVNVNSAAQNTLSSVISNGGGTIALTQSGAGTTILTGANTYTGPTTVSAGTLQLGDGTNGSLSSASPVVINTAGTFTTNLPTGATLSNAVTDNGHFVATGSTNYAISTNITGTGNLTKTGTGAVTLTGPNTYKGGTVVNGELVVQNTTGSGTGTGAVTVNNGGSLGGNGTISGAVALNSGGIIEPNLLSSTGTLHTGALTWNGGGTIILQLGAGGAVDALALNGAMTKGTVGSYNLDLLNIGVTTTPATYTLLTFTSTNFASSSFNLELPAGVSGTLVETSTSLQLTMAHDEAPAGSTPTPPPPLPGDLDQLRADIASPADGTSTDQSSSLSLTPTPEPTSVALLAFGGAALLGYRRRRLA